MSKTYKVFWTGVAQKDLEVITNYIGKGSPQATLKFLRFFQKKATSLKKSPRRGRSIPELALIKETSLKEIIIAPWRLIYRVQEGSVYVLALFDGRRDLEEVLFERLTRLES